MEIILNELSLHDQFSSSENFRETGLKEILKFFQLQKNNYISILKKSDIYSRKVYNGKTMLAVMTSENIGKSDEIKKLKSDLSKVLFDPFWDANKVCDGNSKYTHNTVVVNDSALAECYERDIFLISFAPSLYKENILNIAKNNNSQNISNFTNSKDLVKVLYDTGSINFELFCKSYYNKEKLDFSKIDKSASFDLLNDKNDELQFKNSFDAFADMEWVDLLKNSGLDYKRYHDQTYFKEYVEDEQVYKFRATQKYRVFGYRKKDKFIVLQFDLTHRLSN